MVHSHLASLTSADRKTAQCIYEVFLAEAFRKDANTLQLVSRVTQSIDTIEQVLLEYTIAVEKDEKTTPLSVISVCLGTDFLSVLRGIAAGLRDEVLYGLFVRGNWNTVHYASVCQVVSEFIELALPSAQEGVCVTKLFLPPRIQPRALDGNNTDSLTHSCEYARLEVAAYSETLRGKPAIASVFAISGNSSSDLLSQYLYMLVKLLDTGQSILSSERYTKLVSQVSKLTEAITEYRRIS